MEPGYTGHISCSPKIRSKRAVLHWTLDVTSVMGNSGIVVDTEIVLRFHYSLLLNVHDGTPTLHFLFLIVRHIIVRKRHIICPLLLTHLPFHLQDHLKGSTVCCNSTFSYFEQPCIQSPLRALLKLSGVTH